MDVIEGCDFERFAESVNLRSETVTTMLRRRVTEQVGAGMV